MCQAEGWSQGTWRRSYMYVCVKVGARGRGVEAMYECQDEGWNQGAWRRSYVCVPR